MIGKTWNICILSKIIYWMCSGKAMDWLRPHLIKSDIKEKNSFREFAIKLENGLFIIENWRNGKQFANLQTKPYRHWL